MVAIAAAKATTLAQSANPPKPRTSNGLSVRWYDVAGGPVASATATRHASCTAEGYPDPGVGLPLGDGRPLVAARVASRAGTVGRLVRIWSTRP